MRARELEVTNSLSQFTEQPPSPQNTPSTELCFRYKSETAAKADGITSRNAQELIRHLRQLMGLRQGAFGFSPEYHISLLAWEPLEAEGLPGPYQAEQLNEEKRPSTPPRKRLASAQLAFDLDGIGPDQGTKIANSLVDLKRFLPEQLYRLRGLEYGRDYGVYFTGNKGFRVFLKGRTELREAGLLCDAIQSWMEQLKEQYPTIDTGIYRPSLNGNFVRGPGSRHPETGLWSILLTKEQLEQLFKLPLVAAAELVHRWASMPPSQARRMRRSIEPAEIIGYGAPPSFPLSALMDEIDQEIEDIREAQRLHPAPQKHLTQINLKALIERESLQVTRFIHEGKTPLLKECPCCHKPDVSWLGVNGTLYCFRDHCDASRGSGGLKVSEWATQSEHHEEIFELKAPSSHNAQLKPLPEIRNEITKIDQEILQLPAKPRALLQDASPGSSKSTAALNQVVRLGEHASGFVEFSVPTHDLLQEKHHELTEEAKARDIELDAMIWRGRDAEDEYGPLCTQPQRVKRAAEHHMSIYRGACMSCPSKDNCRYLKQYPKLGQLKKEVEEAKEGAGASKLAVLLSTHHGLWSLTKKELLNPDLIVLDEDPSNAATESRDYKFSFFEKDYAEPPTLAVDLEEFYEPARQLLLEAAEKGREIQQREHDRRRRKACRKKKRWNPKADLRIGAEGICRLLVELRPDAPYLFLEAVRCLREIHKEWSEQKEQEKELWLNLLSAPLRALPLIEAIASLLNQETQKEQVREKGYSVELSFAYELETSERIIGTRQKLTDATFHMVETNALGYQGTILGLDGTGQSLPWSAMLGRDDLEVQHLKAPLHPESVVTWIEGSFYQRTLFEKGARLIDELLVPRVKYELETRGSCLIASWSKNDEYENLIRERLKAHGLQVDGKRLDVIHFFSERGKNRWRNWESMICWGMPVENPDAHRMKAEALSQLVAPEKREELKEQLLYQSSIGEALQNLHRVGAGLGPKHWVLFAGSRFLPLAEHLQKITAPGKFRKVSAQSKGGKDPARLDRLDAFVEKVASIGFYNKRLVAGLMGVDPVSRLALIRLGLLKQDELPIHPESQGFLRDPILKNEPEAQRTLFSKRTLEAYSAKAFEGVFDHREAKRLSERLFTITGWEPKTVSRVTVQEDDGTYRPYQVLGDEDLGRRFLELCSILEGKIEQQVQLPESFGEVPTSFDLPPLFIALRSLMMPWVSNGDGSFDWCKDDQWLWWLNMSLALLSQEPSAQTLEPQAADGAPINRGPP